jgi:hypothetical protein
LLLWVFGLIDPLTAVTWAFSVGTAIAQSEAGKKFIEGTITRFAEMTVDAGVPKINELRKFIIEKLRGNPAAKEALDHAEAGSVDGLKDVANYLEMATRQDAGLAQELTQRVQKIQTLVQFDDVKAKNSQQVFGGTAHQYNNENIDAPIQQMKQKFIKPCRSPRIEMWRSSIWARFLISPCFNAQSLSSIS